MWGYKTCTTGCKFFVMKLTSSSDPSTQVNKAARVMLHLTASALPPILHISEGICLRTAEFASH